MYVETKRLYLRPMDLKDKESVFQYRSDPETYKFLSQTPQNVDDIARFIQHSASTINVPGTWFQLAIIHRASTQLIGDIGLHFLNQDAQNNQVEIGYTLHKKSRGKGLATEALTGVIDYLFKKLDKYRITASIDPANTASIRLMKRLGFRKEAHHIKSLFFRGKYVDDIIYALLASEWLANEGDT